MVRDPPLYDGAQADYLRSIIGLIGAAQQRGIDCSFAYLSNNASITRVRNILLGTFLRSSATHLLFADNDIGFRAGTGAEPFRSDAG